MKLYHMRLSIAQSAEIPYIENLCQICFMDMPVQRPANIIPVNTDNARDLLKKGGGLEIEPVLLNGRRVWRGHVTLPGDPLIYRIVVYNTLKDRYFKSLDGAYIYYMDMVPDAEQFVVTATPVEEITTE